MKKIIVLILVMALVLSLAACGVETENENEKSARFVVVGERVHFEDGTTTPCSGRIFVDMETGVMYLKVVGSYESGMTAILNADGTPMIWEGYEK